MTTIPPHLRALLDTVQARVFAGLRDTVQCCDWLALAQALPDNSVDLCLSDIPYNTTQLAWESEIDLVEWWQQMRRVMKPHRAVVMTGSQPFTSRLVMSNSAWFRYEWIWEKPIATQFLDAKTRPLKAHENVLVFYGGQPVYNPQMTKGTPYETNPKAPPTSIYGSHYRIATLNEGQRYPRTVLQFENERGYHPTQKPVALFEYLIRTYTRPGDLVFDPFVGSGTTALAARNTGRHWITGDLSPEYVGIARARLAEPYTPDMFTALEQPAEPVAEQRTLFGW